MPRRSNHIRERLIRCWHWFTAKDIPTYMFFVALAALIWYAQAMNTSRSVHLFVPVEYTGIEADVQLSDSLPKIVDIEVLDKGNQLRSYGRNSLLLHINIAAQTRLEEGRIIVPADELRRDLASILQGTTSLQKIKPETLEGSYYRQMKKTVPLRYEGTYSAAKQYHIWGEPTIQPAQITIFGNPHQLDTLRFVAITDQPVTDIKDTTKVALPIVLPTGLRAELTEATVFFKAEQFTEKRFMLPVEVKNVPAGYSIHLFPKQVEAILSVGVSRFNQITPASILAYCTFPNGKEEKLEVKLKYENPYIFAARTYPKNIDFLVENEEDSDGGSAHAVSQY